MSAAVDRVLEAYRARNIEPMRVGSGWSAPCLAHDDRKPSLTLNTGGEDRALIHCHAGCALTDIVAALGLKISDLFPHPGCRSRPQQRASFTVVASSPEAVNHGRLEAVAARYRAALTGARLVRLASSLGVTPDSLRALDVGWDSYRRCWTFPMRDGDGRLVGFRLRRQDGSKFTLTGTHEGLFIPADLAPGGRLVVTEGPTDAAALLGLNIPAVARPSCLGGVPHVVRLVRRLHVGDVVIAADRDPPGQRGAATLANVLVQYAPVRVITPPAPAKDVREWITGARVTAEDIAALVHSAAVRALRVQVIGARR